MVGSVELEVLLGAYYSELVGVAWDHELSFNW